MNNHDKSIPQILYKYRVCNNFLENMLSKGEIFFPGVCELEDPNEKASFIFTQGTTIKDKNNQIIYLTPQERKIYFLEIIKSDKNERHGILSLCDSKREEKMWNEYAGDFSGVCVGFDWTGFGLYFAGSYPPVKNIPRGVIYQEALEIDAPHITPEQWLEIFITKLPKYAYEREYRMFYRKGAYAHQAIRHSIKEIILGYKIEPEKIELIRKLISDLPNVKIYMAYLINKQVEIKPFQLISSRTNGILIS